MNTDDEPKEPEQSEDEYIVEKIVGHTLENGQVPYRVRWYKYNYEDATAEPEQNIPNHFIRRYWKRQSRLSILTAENSGLRLKKRGESDGGKRKK